MSGTTTVLSLFLLISAVKQADPAKQCALFSWHGPDSEQLFENDELQSNPFNNLLISNRTCKDLSKPKPIPCISPHIVVPNGTEPDASVVVETYKQGVTCEAGEGNVCAVVVFYFSNAVVNTTYYCTRVTVEETNPMSQGCITATIGTYSNTVCVCDPRKTNQNYCNTKLKIANSQDTINRRHILSVIIACAVSYWKHLGHQ